MKEKPIGRVQFAVNLAFVFVLFFLYWKLEMLWFILLPLSIILLPAIIYVLFNISIRRLNDLGRPSWMSVLLLVPAVNIIFILYLLLSKGEIQNEMLQRDIIFPQLSRSRTIFNIGASVVLIGFALLFWYGTTQAN